MAYKKAYIALKAIPDGGGGGGGGGGGERPPDVPPGFTDYYIATTYNTTTYTITATFNTSVILILFDGTETIELSTNTTFSQSVASGYWRLYVRIDQFTPPSAVRTFTLDDTDLTVVDFANFVFADNIDVSGNSFTLAELEGIMSQVNGFGTSNGFMDLRDNSDVDSNTDKDELEARGWTVLVDTPTLLISDLWDGLNGSSGAFQDANFNERWAVKFESGVLDCGDISIASDKLIIDTIANPPISGGAPRITQADVASKLPSYFQIEIEVTMTQSPNASLDIDAISFNMSANKTADQFIVNIGASRLETSWNPTYLSGTWKYIDNGTTGSLYFDDVLVLSALTTEAGTSSYIRLTTRSWSDDMGPTYFGPLRVTDIDDNLI